MLFNVKSKLNFLFMIFFNFLNESNLTDKYLWNQGGLTEGEGSVLLTSLY